MRAFIVRPFGKRDGFDFDDVEAKLLAPALDAIKAEGRTTLDILVSGDIDTDMFRRLVTADLVIADLTIHNANVFYELGVRHALRKAKTYLVRGKNPDSKYSFDIKAERYLEYDPNDPAASMAKLIKGLREVIDGDRTDSPIYRLLTDLEEPTHHQLLNVPRGFSEDVHRAEKAKDAGLLRLLSHEADGAEWESEAWRAAASALFKIKDFEGARESWEKIRRLDPGNLEANKFLATIFNRLNQGTESDIAVDRALKNPNLSTWDRAELRALEGRNHKTIWREQCVKADPLQRPAIALKSSDLDRAIRACNNGFLEDLNHYYSGLNALSLMVIKLALIEKVPNVWVDLNDTPEDAAAAKDKMTEEVKRLHVALDMSLARAELIQERTGKRDPWLEVSRADLSFLTGKPQGPTVTKYGRAAQAAAPFELQAAQDQLRLFLILDIRADFARQAIAALGPERPPESRHMIVFTGHRVDDPGRAKPRFPPAMEKIAADAIEGAIKTEKERVKSITPAAATTFRGISGAASGGDILFVEACKRVGEIASEIVLAIPETAYKKASVASAGIEWTTRFERIVRENAGAVVVLSSSEEVPGWLAHKKDYGVWQRNSLWTLFRALAHGGSCSLLALWNREPGDGPGGTADLIEQAEKRGVTVVVLETKKLFKE